MDRDVYLILLGAGISLASSIVTLILQFVLGQWNERMRSKRETQQQQSRDVRNALLDKSVPRDISKSLVNRLITRIKELDLNDLDIPTFLRKRREASAASTDSQPRTPFQKFWALYGDAISIGVIVFLFWVVGIFISKSTLYSL